MPDSKTPAAHAVRMFRRWTDLLGVTTAARLLNIDQGYTSRLRAGLRMPSLKVAVRIQMATRASEVGEITPAMWLGHRPRKASSAPAEEAAA